MLDELKKFVELLNKYNLDELEIQDGDFKVSLKKNLSQDEHSLKDQESFSKQEEKKEEDKLHEVVSPMVGIFQHKLSPNGPVLCKKGDIIERGKVIGAIDVLGHIIEIHSEVSGKIKEVLVLDGEAVEYNQPLMRIEKR
jgi:acetyl-CoA carboxylase biotin carboxyl carrier protein